MEGLTPKRLDELYNTFCRLFPNFIGRVANFKENRYAPGIVIKLTDGTQLAFSFQDKKNWWLKTL